MDFTDEVRPLLPKDCFVTKTTSVDGKIKLRTEHGNMLVGSIYVTTQNVVILHVFIDDVKKYIQTMILVTGSKVRF